MLLSTLKECVQCVCVCMRMFMGHCKHVEATGQFSGSSCLLPPCKFWGWNLVSRLGSQYFHPLGHLSSETLASFFLSCGGHLFPTGVSHLWIPPRCPESKALYPGMMLTFSTHAPSVSNDTGMEVGKLEADVSNRLCELIPKCISCLSLQLLSSFDFRKLTFLVLSESRLCLYMTP